MDSRRYENFHYLYDKVTGNIFVDNKPIEDITKVDWVVPKFTPQQFRTWLDGMQWTPIEEVTAIEDWYEPCTTFAPIAERNKAMSKSFSAAYGEQPEEKKPFDIMKSVRDMCR